MAVIFTYLTIVWLLMEKQKNYKAHNIIHKIRTWELRGVDPSFLFEGLDIDYKNLKGSDWLDFVSEVRAIWDNEILKVPNPRDHEELGYEIFRNRSMGVVEEAVKLFSLRYFFKKISNFSRQYSLVELISTHNLKYNQSVILFYPQKAFVDYYTLANPCFLKGLLKALPRIYESKDVSIQDRSSDANVSIEMYSMDLKTVLIKDYGYLTNKIKMELGNDKLLIGEKEYARKINLSIEKCKSEKPYNRSVTNIYTGKESQETVNLDNELEKSGTGFLITDNFIVDNTLILKKGEIFDAPYCRFNVKWKKIPFKRRFWFFAADLSKHFRTPRMALLKQLEIADQRYFNELKARQSEKEAHAKLKEYTLKLEDMVKLRTAELEEEKERVIKAQNLLSRYVAPQLTKKILDGEVDIIKNHKRTKLSFFFSDIENFTGITDALEPEDLADLLNDYFAHMFDIIDKYKGTLAQMTGDGLYVFFGAPDFTDDHDHAERCVKMAMDMQIKMRELQKKWYDSGIEEPFKIRCGINTGVATVGSYGTKKRMEYVAMGMQVNITSRLESSAMPGSIYISHSTWGLVKDKIECEEVGKIDVKGLSRPIRAYKVKIKTILEE